MKKSIKRIIARVCVDIFGTACIFGVLFAVIALAEWSTTWSLPCAVIFVYCPVAILAWVAYKRDVPQ